MELLTIDNLQTITAGICCLAIYSFLIKENPFYRFFEHAFIGIATGYLVIFSFTNFLWPEVFRPFLGFDRFVFPDGTYAEPYNKNYYFFIIPIFFGSLYYLILSKRYAWVAQISIGLSLGVSAGMFFKGFFREIMPQIYDSFRALYVPETNFRDSFIASLNNFIFIFTLISTMAYFFFTFKRQSGGATERLSYAGRWLMMGCFGAFFGTTIMARMALLVERLKFLIDDWFPLCQNIFKAAYSTIIVWIHHIG